MAATGEADISAMAEMQLQLKLMADQLVAIIQRLAELGKPAKSSKKATVREASTQTESDEEANS